MAEVLDILNILGLQLSVIVPAASWRMCIDYWSQRLLPSRYRERILFLATPMVLSESYTLLPFARSYHY